MSFNIIVIRNQQGRIQQMQVNHRSPKLWGALTAGILGIAGICFSAGYIFAPKQVVVAVQDSKLAAETPEEQARLAQLTLSHEVAVLSRHLGELQGNMLRLNAVGQRVAEMAKLDRKEFNFQQGVPKGGPEALEALGLSTKTQTLGELKQSLAQMEALMDYRSNQLEAMTAIFSDAHIAVQIQPEPAGYPTRTGYVSSLFGPRIDPFSGRVAYHYGLDFAAPWGSDVVAVAAGTVTYAGPRAGYGTLVEIDHKAVGLATRYGHNSAIYVKVGDVVQRGQKIAAVGSTGRSTGPHIHFEVLKDGKQINPIGYIGDVHRTPHG